MQSDPKAKMRAANIEIKDKRTARISTAQYPDVGIRMQENYEYCNPPHHKSGIQEIIKLYVGW